MRALRVGCASGRGRGKGKGKEIGGGYDAAVAGGSTPRVKTSKPMRNPFAPPATHENKRRNQQKTEQTQIQVQGQRRDKPVALNPFSQVSAASYRDVVPSTTTTTRDKNSKEGQARGRGVKELLRELKEEVEWESLSPEEKVEAQGDLLAIASRINTSLLASAASTSTEKQKSPSSSSPSSSSSLPSYTADLVSAPVWRVPEAIRSEGDVFKHLPAEMAVPREMEKLHAKLIGLDDLFPGCGLGWIFNHNSSFRRDLRKAMRADLYLPDPTLSEERNRQMQSLKSTLHVVWNASHKNNKEGKWDNMDKCLRKYNVGRGRGRGGGGGGGGGRGDGDGDGDGDGALTGQELIFGLGSLCGGEATSGSLLEIVNISRRKVNHSWHQDSGRAQRTVMLGFPPEDGYHGGGVFSHAVKLDHEMQPQERRGQVVQYDQYQPYPGDIPEEFVIRPVYKQGCEIFVYYDNAHLHSTPDLIHRDAIWRFM